MIDSWNGFDYVKHNRANLLITIGESWTWGDSLQAQWKSFDNKEFRLFNVYGGQLAELLNADFLNIAEPGQSNLWIADHLDLVVSKLDEFNYDRIDIVLTLTEVGREFNGDRDHNRIYTELLTDVANFQNFLDQLSNLIYQQIIQHKNKINLTIGLNFVDNNYPMDLNILKQSWTDLIAIETNQQDINDCFVVLSWVYERFNAIFEFVPGLDKNQWLTDVLEHMKLAQLRSNLLICSSLNYKKASKHPTPEGHALWANYLYNNINQRKVVTQNQ